MNFTETPFLVYKTGTVARSSGTPVAGADSASSVLGRGTQPSKRAGAPGTGEGLVHPGGRPLMVLWVQPARRGPLGRAALRSAGASSGTRRHATAGTAAVSARRASGASGARTVSAGVWGAPLGPAEPCRPLSPCPLQSVSLAFSGRGVGRHVSVLRAWPVTPSVASVGSSVLLATGGRIVTKVSGWPLVAGWGAGHRARAGLWAAEVPWAGG